MNNILENKKIPSYDPTIVLYAHTNHILNIENPGVCVQLFTNGVAPCSTNVASETAKISSVISVP